MPIPPPVKAVLRKDLLLGGGAGALLCAVIAGAVLALGPLLGIDWGGTPDGANGTNAAVALPAIPATSPQAADALRQRAQAPSVTARRRTAPAATASRPAPSVSTQTRQPTVAPRIVTPPSTQDAPVVPAPEAPAPAPAAVAAAAIPATPLTPAKTAKALKLTVAS